MFLCFSLILWIFELLGTFIPDIKFERQHIFLCGDHLGKEILYLPKKALVTNKTIFQFAFPFLAALSKVTGTITKTMPSGFDQIPLFPGVDPEKLLGSRVAVYLLLHNQKWIYTLGNRGNVETSAASPKPLQLRSWTFPIK